MEPITIVHLVRHGEVDNPEGVLYGQLPGYHLSSRGISQAAKTARAFIGADIAYLACSPLERTQETARPFTEITGLTPVIDDALIEAGNDLQGHRVRGYSSELFRSPALWPLLRNPLQPSWGEPYVDIARRMFAAITSARDKAIGKEAICITHQLPIVMVQRQIRGQRLAHNPAVRECALASVTSVVFHGNRISDLRYSEPAQNL